MKKPTVIKSVAVVRPTPPALQAVGHRVEQIGRRHADQERQQDLAEQQQAEQEDRQRHEPEQGEPPAMAQVARSSASARTACTA